MKTSNKNFIVGFIMALISAILFSSKAILVKLIFLDQNIKISSIKILTLRYLIALPILVFIQIYFLMSNNNLKNKLQKLTIKQIIFFCLIGIIGYTGSSWFDFQGLKYVTASIERIVLFTYPAITVFLSALILKTIISKYQIISIILTFIGIFIAFKNEINLININKNYNFGIYLICISSILYSVYLLFSTKYINLIGSLQHANLTIITNAIFLIIFYYLFIGYDIFIIPKNLIIHFIILGIFSTIIPIYLVNLSIIKIGVNNVALISTIGPISTIFQANIILNEPITFLQLLGTFFVILGVCTITIKNIK